MNAIVKRAILGGVVSTIVMATGTIILGKVSGYKAMELLKNSMPGINMLCNTIILGSTTILALMMTLLGLSRSSESKLNERHYKDVLLIAKTDTIVLVVTVITFLMFNLPISESKEVVRAWYQIIYYSSLLMASILGGGFVAVIMMLYGTIANVILIVGLGVTDHPLVSTKDAREEAETQHDLEEEKKKEENSQEK